MTEVNRIPVMPKMMQSYVIPQCVILSNISHTLTKRSDIPIAVLQFVICYYLLIKRCKWFLYRLFHFINSLTNQPINLIFFLVLLYAFFYKIKNIMNLTKQKKLRAFKHYYLLIRFHSPCKNIYVNKKY